MLPLLLETCPDAPFPDPRLADEEGLVAVGGQLTRARLIEAYDHGIFPWYDDSLPPLWWSPDPRGVLVPAKLHVPRSLRRTIRKGGFELTWDTAFEQVMRSCGENRNDGTWVTEDMVMAYVDLHERGHAHSLEVWWGGELVGGIYGVHRGGFIAAESMFHRRTDASKIALVSFVETVRDRGVELIDIQMMTDHLDRFGAEPIRRDDYLRRIRRLRDKPVKLRL